MTQPPAARSGEQNSDRLLTVGRIVGLFGVRGWIKVFSYTRPREAILHYDPWYLVIGADHEAYALAEGRAHGEGIVARLAGIEDRDQAAALIDREIAIRRSQLPAAKKGEYYWSQLEGLRVENLDGEVLGQVSHLFETGANDVMVVRGGEAGKGAKERLIPFVKEVINDVDLAQGVIRVDWDAEDETV